MNILVLSDSHLRPGFSLPPRLWQLAEEAELIVHAGDVGEAELLTELALFAPLRAVYGNCDDWALRRQLPRTLCFEAAGCRIGLVHGDGVYEAKEAAKRSFSEAPDLIIFGHSHRPFWAEEDGILLLNPGSCRLPRGGSPSCALLSLPEKTVRFVELDKDQGRRPR